MKTKLFINNVDIPLSDEVALNLNYQISDIQRPETRQSEYSLTIFVPRSKAADKLFNQLFDINVWIRNDTDTNFNPDFTPNLKTSAVVLSNGVPEFEGIAQLQNIVKKNGYDIGYNVVLFGKLISFFTELGEDELTALDMSAYNHLYTKANIEASWPVPLGYGIGYVYPLVDWGYSSDLVNYNVNALKPWIFAKTYVDKIFESKGWTYDSLFLSGSIFNKLIISPSSSILKLSSAEITSRQFYATLTAEQSLGTTYPTGAQTIIFDNDSVSPGFDNSLQYDSATGKFTCGTGLGATQSYTVKIPIRVDLTVSGGGYAGQAVNAVNELQVYARIYKYTASTAITSVSYVNLGIVRFPDSFNNTFSTPVPGTSYSSGGNFDGAMFSSINANEIYFAISGINISDGDQVYVALSANAAPSFAGAPIGYAQDPMTSTYYPCTYEIFALSDSYFFNNVSDATIIEGMEMDMNGTIPVKIKQKDFLSSIIKMFNLYVQPDPDKPKNLIIEPRDEYYTNDVVNWSKKLCRESELIYQPMGALEAKIYRLKYKDDQDYYNQEYINEFQEPYGTRRQEIPNDFNTQTKDIEVIFSPTPLVGDDSFDRVIPRIVQIDETGAKPQNCNIRVLYYGGLKDTSHTWNIVHSGGIASYAQYPYAGHLDDPYNATIDLSFGMPRRIYYNNTWQPITYTNANLSNVYWYRQLIETTDRNSKIVTGYFNLKPTDIARLDFRKLYRFDNAYFRLNKVIGYNPNANTETKCEFLKVIRASPYAFNPRPIDDSYGTEVDEPLPVMSHPSFNDNMMTKPGSNQVLGTKNTVRGTGNLVVGNGNFIGEGSTNIKIFSDNVVVSGGLKNVTVIDSPGAEITDSNVTMVGGRYVDGINTVVNKKAGTYTIPTDYDAMTTECDISGGNMAISMPPAANVNGKIYYFKVLTFGAGHKVTISPNGIDTIDNGGSVVLNTALAVAAIQSDGTNWIRLI